MAVVTDSTAELPLELAEDRGLRVVPMSVRFGDTDFISRITITDAEFYDRLQRSDALPTTSQPAPPWFEEAYADAADEGLDAVVSVHLSGELSGTVDQARTAAAQAPLPVYVVDSRTVGGGLALAALAAQRRATAGATAEEVIATAEAVAAASETFVIVDTLDYLRRGGRVTGLQAMVGSVLRVRPVLGVVDGRVEVVSRARTWTRAIEATVDLASERLEGRPAHVMVTHALAEDRAATLWERVESVLDVADRLEAGIGPVLGTHTGPGAVSLSVVPADAGR